MAFFKDINNLLFPSKIEGQSEKIIGSSIQNENQKVNIESQENNENQEITLVVKLYQVGTNTSQEDYNIELYSDGKVKSNVFSDTVIVNQKDVESIVSRLEKFSSEWSVSSAALADRAGESMHFIETLNDTYNYTKFTPEDKIYQDLAQFIKDIIKKNMNISEDTAHSLVSPK